MLRRIRLPHLVILLPGIMGSVLQHHGRDLWALSNQAFGRYARTFGRSLDLLRLAGDDPDRETLDDGIIATRLIEQIHEVPRLVKGAGYASIQYELLETFELELGDVADPQPHQNFFPFPYDWRRDLRVAAGRLDRFIQHQLPRWRRHSGAYQARVILIGHSMGGLVARTYTELLGGHESVEVLYTLGTPHRGSLNALNTISNGLWLKKWPLEIELRALTEAVRSFTSIYQLLPIYPCVQTDAQHLRIHSLDRPPGWDATEASLARVAELDSLPNLDPARAAAARELLVAIGTSAMTRARVQADTVAPTLPIVGYGQDTFQQAYWDADGAVALSYHPLPGIESADGDGTVPHFSAVPVEVQELRRNTERFTAQHHGWLPNGKHALGALITDMTYRLDRARFPTLGALTRTQPGLGIRVDDLIAAGVAVRISARTHRVPEDLLPLVARITPHDGGRREQIQLVPVGDRWEATIESLPPGLYQLEVRTSIATPQGPDPVFTVFEVAEQKP